MVFKKKKGAGDVGSQTKSTFISTAIAAIIAKTCAQQFSVAVLYHIALFFLSPIHVAFKNSSSSLGVKIRQVKILRSGRTLG